MLPSSCRLTTANGQSLENHGVVLVDLKIGSIITQQDFIVADLGNCDGILGLDFLEKNLCMLDFSRGVMEIQGKSITLVRENMKLCAKLVVKKSVTIPPRSEMFVETTLNHGDHIQEADGLVEGIGAYSQGESLVVPRCLVVVENDEVSIPITNFSDEEKQIQADTVVAKIDGAVTLSSISLANNEREEASSYDLPDHLEELYQRVSPKIKTETKAGLRRVLWELQDTFLGPGGKLGRNGRARHKINTQGYSPCKDHPRRYPIGQRQIVEDELNKMLEQDIIEPSSSPWAANVVLVRKKDNTVRFCVDYRRLNALTKKDAYPLPHIGDSLDALSGSKWFSVLDLAAGFHQVELDPEAKEKTAFNTHKGLFQYKVLPFGLCNSPPTFQRLMELVLSGLLFERCLVYIDDVVVLGKSEEEALENLRIVLLKFREANLKLKPSKCSLFQEECTYLGHTINADGTTCERKKVEAVQSWPEPRNVTEVRSFLGTCSYYRKYIPNFADIASPLTNLTKKDLKFFWSPACQKAFEELKHALVTAPILSYPIPEGQFILDTDASGVAIGAVLSQMQNGEEKVIAYASAALDRAKQNYCTTYRELFAVVKFVKYFTHYLWGRHFLVRTDHGSLRWLQNFKNPEGVVARWLATLGTYDFTIEHRRGNLHGNADGLSRIPSRKCKREDCQDCDTALRVCALCKIDKRVFTLNKTPIEDPQVRETHPRNADILSGPESGPAMSRTNDENLQVRETHPRNRDIILANESGSDMSETESRNDTELPQVVTRPKNPDWLDSWKTEDLLDSQLQDPVTSTVIFQLESGTKPDQSQMSLYSSSIRTLLRRWDELELIEGLLYIKIRDQVTNTYSPRLVAPEGVRNQILTMLHNDRPAGHLGREKTLAKVKQHVYWPGMAEDVATWVRQCDRCAQRKPGPGRAKHPMGHKNVGIPFERIAIDILGGLPRSHDGFLYIMVVEDYFSKWVEAYCLTEHTAQAVADKLLTKWIC